MNIVSDDYVLVIGSKPFSKLPNILVKKIYCANGAAERAYEYKKKFKNIQVTSVVGASEFNRTLEVRDRVLKLKPDNIFCRSGKINEVYFNNELFILENILLFFPLFVKCNLFAPLFLIYFINKLCLKFL